MKLLKPALFAAAIAAVPLAASPSAAAGDVAAPDAQVRSAYAEGCDWARKTLPDPRWRPFISRIVAACEAIKEGGYLRDDASPRTTGPAGRLSQRFALAVHRATTGLDKLYLELWREQLSRQEPLYQSVGLNGTGVYLAFHHERVFRLAERVVALHEDPTRTAVLFPE